MLSCFQKQPTRGRGSDSGSENTLIKRSQLCFFSVFRDEGMASLYKGLCPALLRQVGALHCFACRALKFLFTIILNLEEKRT